MKSERCPIFVIIKTAKEIPFIYPPQLFTFVPNKNWLEFSFQYCSKVARSTKLGTAEMGKVRFE